jgi:outer membrane protein assembly factor BamB
MPLMPNRDRLKNRIIIWLCILLLPPLGIVLLWMRRDSRLLTKLAGSLAALIFGVLHLVLFWNLRIEFDGSMSRPIVGFKNSQRHNEEIEKLRMKEHSIDASSMPATPPAAVKAVPEAFTPGQTPNSLKEASGAYWIDYRGPGRTGIYAEKELLTEWPSGRLPLLWKRPVGGGYASVVVADGIIFTIEQRRQREVVAAYDLNSGKEKWIHGWDAEFQEILGGNGPRATPVWHDERIYALGATGELRCLDAQSGKRIWSRNILADNQAENLQWGMAASPLIVDNKVIVVPGGSAGKSVVAYDRLTGDPLWKALNDKQSYISPQIVTIAGRKQIMVASQTRVIGLASGDGAILWEFPWIYDQARAAQPIVTGDNRFFISAGYGYGAALVEVFSNREAFETRTVWKNTRMKNKFNSSVLLQGYIYGLDEGILACMDAATGELRWKGGRYGYGQLLLASGHLIISSESGEIALVKASPEKYEELARFQAIEGKTWNVPAIAGGRLIVRNAAEMACFRIAKSK